MTDNSLALPAIANATVIGSQSCSNMTVMNGSVVIGSRMCDEVDEVSSCILIGDSILNNGGVAQQVVGNVYIGNGFGNGGGFTSAAFDNCSVGINNLVNVTSAANNTLFGNSCGNSLTSGSDNICIGINSGTTITTGSNNIIINNAGSPAENDTIRIGNTQTRNFQVGIRGVTTDQINAIPVLVDSLGQLGTVSSSAKYKKDIEPLIDSDVIYKMQPVSFRYIKHADHEIKSIGLIAEQVEQIYPDKGVYQDGELLTVDYARLSILLLAEVQKLKQKIDALNILSR